MGCWFRFGSATEELDFASRSVPIIRPHLADRIRIPEATAAAAVTAAVAARP